MKSSGSLQTAKSPSRSLISTLSRRTMTTISSSKELYVPHRGKLSRVDDSLESNYVIPIQVPGRGMHELVFFRRDLEFAQNLFAILDTESRAVVDRCTVKEFAMLRCPVFWRRDDDLRRLEKSQSSSPTFDEIWKSVLLTAADAEENYGDDFMIGIEGWLVFCRLVALAQYLEAKRRFSARHLQQTMRHRNAPRGSEMVVIDVPPPEPPAPLSAIQLAEYEEKNNAPLPLPELDLDHSLVAAHDFMRHQHTIYKNNGYAKVSIFGSTFPSTLLPTAAASSSASKNLEFALTYTKRTNLDASLRCDDIVVRRSMADMKWLHETFTAHKVLGGTLCGRILPPFPGGSNSGVLASHFKTEDSVINTSIKKTGGAINAAAAGVGIVRDVAKSLFGSYLNNTPVQVNITSSGDDKGSAVSGLPKRLPKKKSNISLGLSVPENYYNPNSPVCKARQLERYLNYLLEHPALSTSFPLNTILQASQSGLEAAKQSLEECTRASKERNKHAPQVGGDDKTMTWACVSPQSPSFAWVRTAAQAAMALKVHGMLETTGLQAASARLQHASLPSFGRGPGREDDDVGGQHIVYAAAEPVATCCAHEGNDFETGVVNVDSCLGSGAPTRATGDDGYDLLPLPVPAPERRILSAGSDLQQARAMARETRFHYGTPSLQGRISLDHHTEDDTASAFLGDISVDENIDKLREVIGSVDNTLSRCLASVGRIGKAQRDRQAKHLEIVRGLDSWSGMRGRFVSQRSLMKGVAGIGQSKDVYEESDLALIDDISWQSSLASSAVAAAEDVRKAVRVSRTASSAKAAASAAAFAAQNVCDNGEFASIDEARAAQTRASIAQSHAIHAAVVEHEANSVKRRAALALAHDVKCWNIHRKREMLKSCIAYARSQHEATRRGVDAWSSLRDGFLGSSVIPSAIERKHTVPSEPVVSAATRHHSRPKPSVDHDEVSITIFENTNGSLNSQPTIVAVEHNILSNNIVKEESAEPVDSDSFLPLATAAPVLDEGDEGDGLGDFADAVRSEDGYSSQYQVSEDKSGDDEVMSASMQSLVDGLMSWGGGFDHEEDHFALPAGMAASIVLEESSILGSNMIV